MHVHVHVTLASACASTVYRRVHGVRWQADSFEDDLLDDGTGGVELQINDAEALTSTVRRVVVVVVVVTQ